MTATDLSDVPACCPSWCATDHTSVGPSFHRSPIDVSKLDVGLWLSLGYEADEPVVVFASPSTTVSLSEAVELRDKLDQLVRSHRHSEAP